MPTIDDWNEDIAKEEESDSREYKGGRGGGRGGGGRGRRGGEYRGRGGKILHFLMGPSLAKPRFNSW